MENKVLESNLAKKGQFSKFWTSTCQVAKSWIKEFFRLKGDNKSSDYHHITQESNWW